VLNHSCPRFLSCNCWKFLHRCYRPLTDLRVCCGVYNGRFKASLSDPHLHSGPLIPPPEFYPHAGSILMDVRLQSSHLFSDVLISVLAIPAVEYFVQSTAIYIGGDMEAFHSRYPAPVIPVVSLPLLSRYSSTNPFPRCSVSFRSSELTQN